VRTTRPSMIPSLSSRCNAHDNVARQSLLLIIVAGQGCGSLSTEQEKEHAKRTDDACTTTCGVRRAARGGGRRESVTAGRQMNRAHRRGVSPLRANFHNPASSVSLANPCPIAHVAEIASSNATVTNSRKASRCLCVDCIIFLPTNATTAMERCRRTPIGWGSVVATLSSNPSYGHVKIERLLSNSTVRFKCKKSFDDSRSRRQNRHGPTSVPGHLNFFHA
jgi:hypothetical protein